MRGRGGIQGRPGFPAGPLAPAAVEWPASRRSGGQFHQPSQITQVRGAILPGRVNARIAADFITHIEMECFVCNWRILLGGAASAAILVTGTLPGAGSVTGALSGVGG